jgi:energy-coupling factor transporter ATP-binding protein EcfA2
MDFYTVQVDEKKDGGLVLSPNFIVGRSKDLMVRGRSFYAIWDEEAGVWSTDEYDVARLVDAEMRKYAEEKFPGQNVTIKSMTNYKSKAWIDFRMFVSNISDNSHQLDESLTFADQEVKRSDYVSRRLPYSLEEGDYSSWDELVGTLYSVEERKKIEWSIGAIISGDSKKIQKFFVFYGRPGSGKSTILSIIEKLFQGYSATFEAKALGSNNNAFSTEAFKSNPLVAIQHDGDLSRIDDNTKLNSIVAHEDIRMNEKYKPSYTGRVNAMLFMGTNQPVKISDAKSGIIRRLIDILPTGVLIPPNQYNTLMSRIDFELGAIAAHCLDVYRSLGKNYYNSYRPTEMQLQTDVIFNFVEYYYDELKLTDGISLRRAYAMYKEYCDTTGIEKPIPQYKLREELRNYFEKFQDKAEVDGELLRSYYSGFSAERFKQPAAKADNVFSLVLDDTTSLLDTELAEGLAQYSTSGGTPGLSWSKVTSKLKELDTSREHFVMVPENHIVIDFDLKGENGGKALARNLEAASAWPPTYGELSKSGEGVHLHYIYDGDAAELSRVYSEGIEVKVFTGKASLRRRLTKCNTVPIATLKGGLPLKEKSKVLTADTIKSERGLRDLIARNFRKEIHPGTKPSIDFIAKILDDAYAQGLTYDVSDLRPKLVAFANNSSNQSLACLKIVQRMRFASEPHAEATIPEPRPPAENTDSPVVFYDVEVFPNLFVVCWMYENSDTVVRMINPTAEDMERLFKLKLVGFYNRRYDNHIVYGRFMGYNNAQLFALSQKLISNGSGAMFAAAYNLSYADIWDFSSEKKSLKKFEIELGIPHQEFEHPWDQDVPEEMWDKVAEYCENDVRATKAVWQARQQDFVARQILADLSGLTVNDPTAKHTATIIFEGDRNPQSKFIYTNLAREFEGYEFDAGKSTYMGEEVGEGGYVYAEPGMYNNVALLDVASMHPTSIIELNMFGEYTKNFKALVDARLAIKNGDYEAARSMLSGKLAPYLKDAKDAKDLSWALKIIINIVYGLTSATFDSPFRDKRNKDNIAAKRGALFMIELKNYLKELGYKVVHIKTDSIKIANFDDEVIDMVYRFGEKYGYTFEHEATYSKFCLVNDAVYVAKTEGNDGGWSATGAQFKVPYVFKTLFNGEPILPQDLAETKQVAKGYMYLKYENDSKFVGKTGRFIPVVSGGGELIRKDATGKEFAVTGTKGYRWLESDAVKAAGLDPEVDITYFEKLVDKAKETIEEFGSFEEFVAA